MTYTYVIDDIPPSNNRFLGKNRRFEYNKEKKDWAFKVNQSIHKLPKEPLTRAKVHIHYVFPDNRKRDPDNYSGKFILDPLVKAGVLIDDSFKVVRLELSCVVEKGKKQTYVFVTEVK